MRISISEEPVRLRRRNINVRSRAPLQRQENLAGRCGGPFECTGPTVCPQTLPRYPDAGQSTVMPTITFDVPEGTRSALRLSPTEFVTAMRVAAALLWSSHAERSPAKAAEIAGTSRATFIDEVSRRRIPVVQVTAEELQHESHPRRR